MGSPILLNIVSENRFSGKTYFIQLVPGEAPHEEAEPEQEGGVVVELPSQHLPQLVAAVGEHEAQVEALQGVHRGRAELRWKGTGVGFSWPKKWHEKWHENPHESPI